MKADEIFKRYDVRGKYPEELNKEFAERIGRSVAQLIIEDDRFESKVVVGRDNKQTSGTLKEKLVKGLKSSGLEVLDAGIGPTDYTAFHGVSNNCVSVQVTASHMPLDFNGFKFMYPEGNGFVNEDLNRIEDNFRQQEFMYSEGALRELENPREEYIEEMNKYVEDFEEINDRKIVVDTLGGASTDFLPQMLKDLGFEVVNIAEEKKENGPYYNPPNPKPEILEHMPERVREEDADLGLATDMDADRVAVYYDGRWLSGDELFFLFSQIFEGEVVASIDSSTVLEDFAEEVHYTRVGDPFVIDRTLEEQAALSGEPNGHYCFPDFVAYNSGTLAAMLLAVTDIDPLLQNIPDIYLEKANLEVEQKEEIMDKVEEDVKVSYNVLSDQDGVKFEVRDSSVLVRPSGSSPVIRLKVESGDPDEAAEVLKEVEELVRKNI